jgi:hypothetical protein
LRWSGAVFVGLAGLEPAASSLSAIGGLPLCDPAFLQVVRDRKGRSNALFERVSAGRSTLGSKSSRGNSRHCNRHSLLTKSVLLTCTEPPSAQSTPYPNPTPSSTSAQPAHRPPTNALAITDDSYRLALLSTPTFSEDSSAPRRCLARRRARVAAWWCGRQCCDRLIVHCRAVVAAERRRRSTGSFGVQRRGILMAATGLLLGATLIACSSYPLQRNLYDALVLRIVTSSPTYCRRPVYADPKSNALHSGI